MSPSDPNRFSQPVKNALAIAAGHRCSFPGCPAITAGPSREKSLTGANTGEAAHISGAGSGKGSRRYDPNLTPELRGAAENGIWCCRTHAHLIDTDTDTYSTEMIKKWKLLAEKKASLRQRYGADVELPLHRELIDIGLAPERVALALTFANSQVGELVRNCCIEEIWGKKTADYLREFLIEYARNTFEHGDARRVSLTIEDRGIRVEDDGRPFDVHRLGTSGDGGSKAYRALTELARLATIANQQNQPRGNHLTITLTNDVETLLTHNPCVAQLPFDEAVHSANLARMADCTKIYLVASEFLTYSDSRRYRKYIEDAQIRHKHVSLILHTVSDRVLEHYKAEFPGVEVVCWDGE